MTYSYHFIVPPLIILVYENWTKGTKIYFYKSFSKISFCWKITLMVSLYITLKDEIICLNQWSVLLMRTQALRIRSWFSLIE